MPTRRQRGRRRADSSAPSVGVSLVPESVSQSARHGVAYRGYVGHNPGTSLSLNYRRDNRAPHLFNFLKTAQHFVRQVRDKSDRRGRA